MRSPSRTPAPSPSTEYVGLPADRPQLLPRRHPAGRSRAHRPARGSALRAPTDRPPSWAAECAALRQRCSARPTRRPAVAGHRPPTATSSFNEPGWPARLAHPDQDTRPGRPPRGQRTLLRRRRRAIAARVLTQGIFDDPAETPPSVLLAWGPTGKAHAVAALAEGPVAAMVPASALQWHPHVTVVVDQAAQAFGVAHLVPSEVGEPNRRGSGYRAEGIASHRHRGASAARRPAAASSGATQLLAEATATTASISASGLERALATLHSLLARLLTERAGGLHAGCGCTRYRGQRLGGSRGRVARRCCGKRCATPW